MSGELLCVIPGPREVLREEDAGVRWCFACRVHVPHTYRLLGDPFPSYYDPVWSCQCSRCGKDRTRFPSG